MGSDDRGGGATSPQMQAATSSWKRQGPDALLEPVESTQACRHPDFCPPGLQENKSVLF